MYVWRHIEARSCNHCCRGKAKSNTYCERVFVVSGIQHAMRMRRIAFSYVACQALQYFSTLSHKRHDFWKNGYRAQNVCFDSLYIFVWKLLTIRRNERDMTINVARSPCKVPDVLVTFNVTFCFDVLLTVHFSIILVFNQLNAQNLFFL